VTKRTSYDSLLALIESHIIIYPTGSALSYLWSFGFCASVCLGIQILSGVFLGMHYIPNINYAFDSIEHIMRDVASGWFIRYLHANGASFFFLTVYLHLFRGIYFGSYIERTKLWNIGVVIFIAMMATAFMGYVLPWGQMSFWGATVITNLFSAIPVIGGSIVEWLWGGFSVDNATLNRFFSLHYLLPFIIAALVIAHLAVLHEKGSSNPVSVEKNFDSISFFPYFYVKDLYSMFIFLIIFILFVCFYPNVLGHSDNYIQANSLVTPAHIVPEWYFLPFYAILRSIPDKLVGVIAMFLAIIMLILLPFFNMSLVKNTNYRFFFCLWILDNFFKFFIIRMDWSKTCRNPLYGNWIFCYYFLF